MMVQVGEEEPEDRLKLLTDVEVTNWPTVTDPVPVLFANNTVSIAGEVPVSLANNTVAVTGTVPVSGPLTNAQLTAVQGTAATAAWAGTGNGTTIAILKAIYAQNEEIKTLLNDIKTNTTPETP